MGVKKGKEILLSLHSHSVTLQRNKETENNSAFILL